LIGLLTGTMAINFQETAPIVWREAQNVVAAGFERVYMKVKLKSPCKMIKAGMVQTELMAPAMKTCNSLYQDMIIGSMTDFCPFKPQHRLVKRELITIGIIAISAIVMAGIGTTSVIGIVKANQNKEEIEILTNNMNLTRTKVNDLIGKHNNLVDVVDQISSRLDGHINSTVSTTYSQSYITTQLVMGQTLTKNGAKDWKTGKVNAQLLDFWNITLPCNKSCPPELGTPISCSFLNDTGYWYLTFDVPLLNNKQKLLIADPFTLMLKEQEKTCTVKYIGAEVGVREMSKGESCF